MAKRQDIRAKRRQQEQRSRLIWIGALVVGVILLLAIVLPLVLPGLNRVEAADIQMAEEKPHPQADFNRLGNPDAPVKVVEFADYLCSHCQTYALNTERLFIETYVETGQVYYEYLPLSLQAGVPTESVEATYCAGDQDAFWPFKDLVYTNIVKTQNAISRNYLNTYAEVLGLNMQTFNECMRGKYRNMNQQNLMLGQQANIPGTPTFVVNGTKASRVDLFQVVDAELAKAGQGQ
jgi:protein-disulfide isomerase